MIEVEQVIAKNVMGYEPTDEYGIYTFMTGDMVQTVEFRPRANKEHAFMLLDRMSDLGYDYAVQCRSDDRLSEDNIFLQKDYVLSMKNRNNHQEDMIVVEGESLYDCIMIAAIKLACRNQE